MDCIIEKSNVLKEINEEYIIFKMNRMQYVLPNILRNILEAGAVRLNCHRCSHVFQNDGQYISRDFFPRLFLCVAENDVSQ